MKASKRKCVTCKKRYPVGDMWIDGLKAICNTPECIAPYALAKTRKEKARKEAQDDKEYKAKTRSIRKGIEHYTARDLIENLRKDIFNPWVKLRDKDEPCISCGQFAEVYEAGHYLSVGARPDLRFNPDNCHKQCFGCNRSLKNGHTAGMITAKYRANLVEKIGLKRVEALEVYAIHRFRVPELREIKAEYAAKLKVLKAEQ